MKAKGLQLAVMIVTAIALIPVILAWWVGPLAYGIVLLAQDRMLLGAIVAAAGAAWAILVWRDKTGPGLLFGIIGSLLVEARLMKDPWEDPEYKELLERVERGEFTDRPPRE